MYRTGQITRTIDTLAVYESVARVLAYYALFEFPLTAREIYTFLPDDTLTEFELTQALPELVAEGLIRTRRGYYHLDGTPAGAVERRIEMERHGEGMWRAARRVASVMRMVPFVRGVFISGQLCRYISDEQSDIDYFILTEPGRLWIVRTIIVLARRTLLLNRRKYLCANYFVTTDNLNIRERNAYTACEVASVKPMLDYELFERFLAENSWIRSYFPNFSLDRIELREGIPAGSAVQRLIEGLLPTRLASRIDVALMQTTRRHWKRKFAWHDDASCEKSLLTRRNESRAYPFDYAPRVLESYRRALRSLGFDHD